MKLWRLLTLPGYALSETARYAWLALSALMLGGVFLVTVFTHADTQHWMLNAAHGWAAANATWWVFLANTVLLARNARAMRLPTLEREALMSLGLYAALGIGLPALLLSLAGGHLLAVAIMLLFGAGLGAAFALLPSYLAVFALFADSIPAALSRWLPLPMQPGFGAWAGPLVALLWLALAWRMRALLRGDHSLQQPNGPMVMIYRRLGLGWGRDGKASRWGDRTPGQGPAWPRSVVDLRGCGPGYAVRSLRVALGGWWMPQTRRSRLRQCALLLVGASAGALILWMQGAADRHAHAANLATAPGGTGNLVFFGALMSAILAISTVRALYQRRGKTNAELPLLALLPGLGDAATAKRSLLRASLLPALGVQFGLALMLLILAGLMHLGSEGAALLLLAPLGSSVLMCAFALQIFAADVIRGWGMALAMGAGYVWICVGAGTEQFNATPAVNLSNAALLVLALGWSTFFVTLLWLGRRGWCVWQQHPHAFLAN
ncbi:MAG TPA: hypothetical protein VN043_13080 [Rhodanobacter sp.]|nr:hypothetical protein [Rhodanobacter sp.]